MSHDGRPPRADPCWGRGPAPASMGGVRAWRRSAAMVALLASMAAGGCAAQAGLGPVNGSAVDPGFYVTPNPMPAGSPGDVLRTQKVQTIASGTVWRVLYRSESLDGA